MNFGVEFCRQSSDATELLGVAGVSSELQLWSFESAFVNKCQYRL